ncbi:hypothetical protein DL96DRAFT_1734953 [Flagelloscypha sp. PMI_526]|nr:hypothetical protein DL96DRAFT_1734953 [Flagelloscypha sp. PMI_526]
MTNFHRLPLTKRKYNKDADDIDSPRLKRQKHSSSSSIQRDTPAMASHSSFHPPSYPDSEVQNSSMATVSSVTTQTSSPASTNSPTSSAPYQGIPSSTKCPSPGLQAGEDILAQRSYASAQALLQDYIPIIQKFINQERPMPMWSSPGPQKGARPLRSKQLGTKWLDYKILRSSSVYFQQYCHQSELTSRIILDSMCHHWGLYFAPNPKMRQELGSCDIQLALEASFEATPDARRFSDELEPVGQLMFGSVLLARLLVLQLFMEGLTYENVQQRRMKWVVAQQAPYKAFRGLDIFALLSQDIRAILSHDQIIIACHRIWQCTLSPVLRKFSWSRRVTLSVVLDWADQAVPPKAPNTKNNLAMRAGLSCWTSILLFDSGAEFKVVCDKLMYLFTPDYVLKLSSERQDGPQRPANVVSGSLQFRKRRS